MDSLSQLEQVECSMAIYAATRLQSLEERGQQWQGAPLSRSWALVWFHDVREVGECGVRQPINSKDPGNVGITFVQLLGLHQRPSPLPRA